MEENNIEKLPEENSNSEDIKTIISSKDVTLSYFGITASELEDMMTSYKERDSHYSDLKYLENIGGIDSLLKKLKTDKTKGINSVDCRENEFGSNRVFIEPVRPFCSFVLESLEDLMIRILIVAAIVEIVLGTTLSDNPKTDWIDGLSIIIAIVVVVLVGSITNYNKEKKFHELNDIQKNGTRYKVIRNGSPNDLTTDDILVGDLIKINYGDIMPADLILIEGNGIKMDESSLTGESDAVKKMVFEECIEERNNNLKPHSPFILSGTNCIEGNGMGIVIAVGEHSQKGIIKRIVDNAQEDNKTPLEQKLDIIAEMIGWFGMGAAVVTLVALSLRFVIQYIKDIKNYNKQIQNLSKDEAEKLTDPKKQIPKKILDIIILCVSIIVVAIPEGLPLAVTLSLAFSIKKLMDNNNLVRKMHACETMGGANYICTDKTGTLTNNEMNVYKILTANDQFHLNENLKSSKVGELDANNEEKKIREDHSVSFENEDYWNVLKISLALNVEGTIKKLVQPDNNGDTEIFETKNKTDKAFIDFLYRFKSPISIEKDIYFNNNENYKQFPFDSKRKRMTTLVKNENFPTGYRLFTKGGAENVSLYCTKYIDIKSGEIHDLTEENYNYIKNYIETFNKEELRSLYICYKDISKEEYENCNLDENSNTNIDQKDLIFISVFGIRDSLRYGVKEAVLKCHEASVNVIMVTGDNLITATAIAKDCHILPSSIDLDNIDPNDIEQNQIELNTNREKHINYLINSCPVAMTGNSFYAAIGGLICETCGKDTNKCQCPKTEAEANEIANRLKIEPQPIKKDRVKDMKTFTKLIQRLRVLARSQPIHKYALVLGLKSLEYVVGVTGDGTNDAPALSKSDVGFSMFAGTDIAKEASDIVILDNNFSSIVIAIIYGRNIYDNIRKFLQFQLTVNFCACLLVFICACIGNETPLTSIQMLWVNLIMDSLGSLSLATEPPYYELLNRKPTRKNESIINGRMWKHIILQSMFQLLLLLALYLWAPLFITESNLTRLAENKIINECYGVLPGEAKNINNIIFGTESSWSSDIRILNNANEMKCGSYNDRQNLGMAFKEYMSRNGSTVHMTLIFNVFVFYTLFNQVNCRVINDGFNIFVRINKCILFILITSCEMGLQALLVEFGSYAFHVTKNGLTIRQWLITFGFAATTFVLSFIIKLIPLEKAIQPYLDVEEDHSYHEENEEKDNIIKNDIDEEKKGLLEGEEI